MISSPFQTHDFGTFVHTKNEDWRVKDLKKMQKRHENIKFVFNKTCAVYSKFYENCDKQQN